jgi:hypothetical protein
MTTTTRDILMGINNTKEFIDTLKKFFGYEQHTNNGGHLTLKAHKMPTLSLPYGKQISPGVKRDIIKLIMGDKYYSKQKVVLKRSPITEKLHLSSDFGG